MNTSSRPRPYHKKQTMISVHYRLPRNLVTWIMQQAEALDMTPTQFVRGTLMEVMLADLYGQEKGEPNV